MIELGHIKISGRTEPCVCGGRGCLEAIVSEPIVRQRLLDAGLTPSAPAETSAFGLLEGRADADVSAIRSDVVETIAHGIAHVASILNPGLILLGGALANAPAALLADVRTRVTEELFPLLRDDLQLEVPSLPFPGISAGGTLALEEFYYTSTIA